MYRNNLGLFKVLRSYSLRSDKKINARRHLSPKNKPLPATYPDNISNVPLWKTFDFIGRYPPIARGV